jgi:hypothetical protein
MSMTSITTKTAVQGLRQDQPRITRRTLSSKLGRKTVAAPIEVASPAAAVMANAVPNVCADVCVWVEGSMSRSKCNGVREQLKKQVWAGDEPRGHADRSRQVQRMDAESTGRGKRRGQGTVEGRKAGTTKGSGGVEWGCVVGFCPGCSSLLLNSHPWFKWCSSRLQPFSPCRAWTLITQSTQTIKGL